MSTAEDTLVSHVAGTLRGPEPTGIATGTITFWPRRFPGGFVVGPRRIAL